MKFDFMGLTVDLGAVTQGNFSDIITFRRREDGTVDMRQIFTSEIRWKPLLDLLKHVQIMYDESRQQGGNMSFSIATLIWLYQEYKRVLSTGNPVYVVGYTLALVDSLVYGLFSLLLQNVFVVLVIGCAPFLAYWLTSAILGFEHELWNQILASKFFMDCWAFVLFVLAYKLMYMALYYLFLYWWWKPYSKYEDEHRDSYYGGKLDEIQEKAQET